ncbi:hypothetical protein [Catenuloplanes atrovinosus]|uniref:WXG100 family type VII secretion target n=1 Tax=Catenuloplanes atrovinosus TaxID=137266 RepID=A0AAE4C777_9ACTN|nr:hypothetical protein [Catenuloplanes atrovinosus]MDR7274256.1 hypothetical protein [Catenuloplanes atrovinosus]
MSEATPDADLAEVGATINALAADVAERLAALRDQLEPTREQWTGGRVYLGPADEWTIAVDGLFGPSGVLNMINNAMNVTPPDFPAAGWGDAPAGGRVAG